MTQQFAALGRRNACTRDRFHQGLLVGKICVVSVLASKHGRVLLNRLQKFRLEFTNICFIFPHLRYKLISTIGTISRNRFFRSIYKIVTHALLLSTFFQLVFTIHNTRQVFLCLWAAIKVSFRLSQKSYALKCLLKRMYLPVCQMSVAWLPLCLFCYNGLWQVCWVDDAGGSSAVFTPLVDFSLVLIQLLDCPQRLYFQMFCVIVIFERTINWAFWPHAFTKLIVSFCYRR